MQSTQSNDLSSTINRLIGTKGRESRKKLTIMLSSSCTQMPAGGYRLFELSTQEIEKCLDFLQEDYIIRSNKMTHELFKKIYWRMILSTERDKLEMTLRKANFADLFYCTMLAEANIKHMQLTDSKLYEYEIKNRKHAHQLLLVKLLKQAKTQDIEDVFMGMEEFSLLDKTIKSLEDIKKSFVFSRLIETIKARGFSETQIFEHCLLYAAQHDNERVKFLLENKVDPNTPHISSTRIYPDGRREACTAMPLLYAVNKNPESIKLINLLIEYKADVNSIVTNVTSEVGKTRSNINPEIKDFQKEKQQIKEGKSEYVIIDTQYGFTPLIYAANAGTIETMSRLLQESIHVNATTLDGHSALFYAASRGSIEMVNLLLTHGADPFLVDHHGLSAIDATNDNNVKNSIRKYIAVKHFEDLGKEPKAIKKQITNDLIDQLYAHIKYEKGEILIDITSLREKLTKKKTKINNTFLTTILEKLPEKIIITDEQLEIAKDKITTSLEQNTTGLDLLTIILQCSKEYSVVEAKHDISSKKETPSVTEQKAEPIITPPDANTLYNNIVIATAANIPQNSEVKVERKEGLQTNASKNKIESTQIELDYLTKELKAAVPTSIPQMIEQANAILYAFGSLMRKIVQIHENFTQTTVDTLFPGKLAQHLSNVNFHSHRSPLFFMSGNLRATQRYCNAIRTMVGEIVEQIKTNPRPDNDPTKMVGILTSSLFKALQQHVIPDTTDVDCIAQLTLVIRELKLYERAANEEVLANKVADPQRKQFAKCFTLSARAAPYLKWHLVLNLNVHYPEIHDKLMETLPLLISNGYVTTTDQENINKTFLRVVEHIQKIGGTLRHPTLATPNTETLVRMGLLRAPAPANEPTIQSGSQVLRYNNS